MDASTKAQKLELIERNIRDFPDFPTKGIVFKDICPIVKEPKALTAVIDLFEEHVRQKYPQTELIVGLEARGFLFGPLLSQRLGIGFVPVRKKGKLPGPTVAVEYTLEYAMAEAEVQVDCVERGQQVILIDDLLATGGTLSAACELMKKLQAEVLCCLLVVELKDLPGTLSAACELMKKLQAEVLCCLLVVELKDLPGAEKLKPIPVYSLVQY